MQQLIPVTPRPIGQHTVPAVNARELHAYLESKQDFSNWINNRIKQYNFMENQDFILVLNQQNKVSNKIIENPQNPKNKGGRPTKEYFLTLDMAKELSMVERIDKGRTARRYFIDCEQRLYQLQQTKDKNKVVNHQFTQLIYTLKNTVLQQQAMMSRMVKLQEQSNQLQAQTLKLLSQRPPKKYRHATNEDYFRVVHLLQMGNTITQVSSQLGISPYAVRNIKQGRVVYGEDGLLKLYTYNP